MTNDSSDKIYRNFQNETKDCKYFNIVRHHSDLLKQAEQDMITEKRGGKHRKDRSRGQVHTMQDLQTNIEMYMGKNKQFLTGEHQQAWQIILAEYSDLFKNEKSELLKQAAEKNFLAKASGGLIGRENRNNVENDIRASVLVVKAFYETLKKDIEDLSQTQRTKSLGNMSLDTLSIDIEEEKLTKNAKDIDNKFEDFENIFSNMRRYVTIEKLNVGEITFAKKRSTDGNQDSFFVDNDIKSFGVFDGVSSSFYPEEASKRASEFIKKEFATLSENMLNNEIIAKVTSIFKEANIEVCEITQSLPDHERPTGSQAQTTALAMKVFKDGRAVIAHVGDSRAYLFNRENESLEHLTLDDSGMNEFIEGKDKQWKNQKELANSNQKPWLNAVTQFLGNRKDDQVKEITPNVAIHQLNPDDIVILATDGLTGNLKDDEIKSYVEKYTQDIQKMTNVLGEEALNISKSDRKRKNEDDITIIAVEVKGYINQDDGL